MAFVQKSGRGARKPGMRAFSVLFYNGTVSVCFRYRRPVTLSFAFNPKFFFIINLTIPPSYTQTFRRGHASPFMRRLVDLDPALPGSKACLRAQLSDRFDWYEATHRHHLYLRHDLFSRDHLHPSSWITKPPPPPLSVNVSCSVRFFPCLTITTGLFLQFTNMLRCRASRGQVVAVPREVCCSFCNPKLLGIANALDYKAKPHPAGAKK